MQWTRKMKNQEELSPPNKEYLHLTFLPSTAPCMTTQIVLEHCSHTSSPTLRTSRQKGHPLPPSMGKRRGVYREISRSQHFMTKSVQPRIDPCRGLLYQMSKGGRLLREQEGLVLGGCLPKTWYLNHWQYLPWISFIFSDFSLSNHETW